MSDIANSNANPPDALIKRCTKCGETKPCAAFSKDKKRRDGLQPQCKQCIARYRSDNADKINECQARYRSENVGKERERSARYRSENADKINEYQARYRSENAAKLRERKARYYRENPAKERERRARYNRENAAKVRERKARYQRKNPAKVREGQARWQQANLDKKRANSHRRRATERALPAQWTGADAQRMLAYWGNCCAICSQRVEPNNAFYILAADHWIAITDPRPDNPGTVPWNMLPLCHSKIGNAAGCNSAKSDADPIAWLNRLYPDDPKLVAKILARIAKYFKTVTDGAL